MSVGGFKALEFALAYPERLQGAHPGPLLDRPDDITGLLAALCLPVLVVFGEENVPLPIERAEAMADALPDATFVRVPGAGHSVSLEKPEIVTAAIARYPGRLDLS